MRLIFLLCLLKMSVCYSENLFNDKIYLDLVQKMQSSFVESIPKERNLILELTTGHLTFGITGFQFKLKGLISKEEMRELLISLTSEYLSKINDDKSIRPYMSDYPFTSKNVVIQICVEDPKNKKVLFPNVETAMAVDFHIYYSYFKEEIGLQGKKVIEFVQENEHFDESQK